MHVVQVNFNGPDRRMSRFVFKLSIRLDWVSHEQDLLVISCFPGVWFSAQVFMCFVWCSLPKFTALRPKGLYEMLCIALPCSHALHVIMIVHAGR